MSLQDASVVIIGGSSGIGFATARLAASQGARVTIVGRDTDRLAAAMDELGVAGVSADVADEGGVRDLFDSFDHVDHVVNLAGTHVNGAVADLATTEMSGPVDNRFWGPIYVFKYAPAKMTDGSITICTGSGVGRPRAGGSVVSAACAGAEKMAQAMSLELKPIRVNVIRPGIIDTPLLDRMSGGNRQAVIDMFNKTVPVGRPGRPEEVADALVFLMTNTYMNGSILTIDGGVSNV
jgi:NAD(P)-dependent dehydrogenase (short-subunit alcohol dehydrogenase family)